MWLWPLWVVLGFGEPWSVGCSCLLGRALLADVRLLGVGMLRGRVGPRAVPLPPSGGACPSAPWVLERTMAPCSEL